jgi:hypothetical protein
MAKGDDPVDKAVERKTVVNVMLIIEVALRPMVKDEAVIDLGKVYFGK